MPQPPAVSINRMLAPTGLPVYHLCAAKPPKKKKSSNVMIKSSLPVILPVSSTELEGAFLLLTLLVKISSFFSEEISVCFKTTSFFSTGNEAKELVVKRHKLTNKVHYTINIT